MTVHIALSGSHLHRPSLAALRRSRRYIVQAGSLAGWLTAGATVVGLGYGPHLAFAGAMAGAYLLGAYRSSRYWRARFAVFAVGIQAGNRALGQLLAQHERVWVERFDREAAERNSLPGRHINAAYTNAYVSNERGSR